jgi:hypothetical protein
MCVYEVLCVRRYIYVMCICVDITCASESKVYVCMCMHVCSAGLGEHAQRHSQRVGARFDNDFPHACMCVCVCACMCMYVCACMKCAYIYM